MLCAKFESGPVCLEKISKNQQWISPCHYNFFFGNMCGPSFEQTSTALAYPRMLAYF